MRNVLVATAAIALVGCAAKDERLADNCDGIGGPCESAEPLSWQEKRDRDQQDIRVDQRQSARDRHRRVVRESAPRRPPQNQTKTRQPPTR